MRRSINGVTYNPPYIMGTNSTTTSTTSETMLNHVFIPANTFKQYDLFGLQTRISKTSTGATCSLRVRINTSAAVGGTVVGIFTPTTASDTCIPFERRFSIQNTTTSTIGFSTSTTNTPLDFSALSTNDWSTFSIDWTTGQFIIVTSQTTSLSEVVNCPYIYLDLIEPRV